MCGAALHVLLLLCVGASAFLREDVVVTTPAGLIAEVDLPLLLSCNVTIQPGESPDQVMWSNEHGETLLAYQPLNPPKVSVQDNNVELVESRSNSSSIRIVKVQPDGGTCYNCIFNIYMAGGTIEGKVCFKLTGRVHPGRNQTAVSGQPLTLSCRYSFPGDVHQVVWKKRVDESGEHSATVARYANSTHPTVEQGFQGRVSLNPSMGHSKLTLLQPRVEDEGCYICQFNTLSEGDKSATVCLVVHVLPQRPQLTLVTQVSCTARSHPAAELSWEVAGANATLAPPVITRSQETDGTSTVTSTLLLRRSETDATATCVVQHPGLPEPLKATLGPSTQPAPPTINGPSMLVILMLCASAALLVLGLAACLCKRLCCAKA